MFDSPTFLPIRAFGRGLLLCFFGALMQSAQPLAAADAEGFSLRQVVVALKPDKNPDAMVAERAELAAYLKQALGRPAEVIVPLSASVILEGLANGSVDLAYLSATDMVAAQARGIAELLLAGEIAGKTSYRSYWVTLKEKPYASIEELRDRPIAFASKTSTSGYVVPLWDLQQRGLLGPSGRPEAFFGKGNVWFGSGYVSGVERVLNGEAEAAAVSDYVMDKDKHLDAAQRARLRVLATQGPVPTHVIAVRSSLSAADRAVLKRALTGLDAPAHEGLRDKVFTSKLVEVDPAKHLGGLREALELARKGAE